MRHFTSVMLALVVLVMVLTVAACDNSSGTTPTATSPNTTTTTLTGTVPAAMNGAGQTASSPFTVGQSGGTVSVTLTSAVETFPNGTLKTDVVMGIGVGTPTGGTCTLPSGSPPALLSAGASSTISGALNAGAYCVQVSDQTVQQGPVAYTLVIVSP
jgi:hypothetical protein